MGLHIHKLSFLMIDNLDTSKYYEPYRHVLIILYYEDDINLLTYDNYTYCQAHSYAAMISWTHNILDQYYLHRSTMTQ